MDNNSKNDVATATQTDFLLKKIETLEKTLNDVVKKQHNLQDAFYKLYEDQRRRERKL